MKKIILSALLSLGLLGTTIAPVEAKPMPERINYCYGLLDRRPAIDLGIFYQCKGPGSARATIVCSKRENSWSSGVYYRHHDFSVRAGTLKTVRMYCNSSYPHILELNLVRFSN